VSGFGFISPALLAFGVLSIPIFLLYMLRLRRTDMQISSTFLWQQLVRDREANAPWQKLRPNLLMLLQLLILLALVFALARPFREVKTITTGRTILLIDASASMKATDGEDGKTRFELAQQEAIDAVGTLGSDDTMTVIRVAAVPEVLAAETRDRSVLRDAIEDAEPSDGMADWGAAIALASAGARGVDTLRVVVMSDGGVPTNLPEVPGEVSYVKVGESASNVAITALSTRTLPNSPPQLFAQISNFGDQDTEVILELRLDGLFYNSQFYDIPANSTRNVIIEDIVEDFGELTAVLSPRSNSTVPDYLEIDNTAYAVNGTSKTGNVLVMTESNPFIEAIFASLLGVEVTVEDPQRGIPSGDFDLIVLDGWVPNGALPNTDLFIINPPESTNAFEVTGESDEADINPITGGIVGDDDRTRFVDFSNVHVRSFRTLNRYEDWATILIETELGEPLVLAGQFEGQQIAIMTFALEDSDLQVQLPWPILVNGLINWYQPQRPISFDNLRSGDTLLIRPTVDADEVRIELPNGDDVSLELNDRREAIFADTSLLGFYHIEILNDGDVVQEDGFAVNLFDINESDIQPIEDIVIQTSEGQRFISGDAREETGRRELWTLLVALGLLILGLEWWYYHRTLNKKPQQVRGSILQGTQRRSLRPQQSWWKRLLRRA
jgi:hypothetical protein